MEMRFIVNIVGRNFKSYEKQAKVIKNISPADRNNLPEADHPQDGDTDVHFNY